jgi:hypothetical protein
MSERSERGDFTAAARRIGANRAAGLGGLGPAVESLDRLQDVMDGPEMEALVNEHTDIMLRDAQSRAAGIGKTGRYREAIRKRVFKNADGYAGTVFVIQLPWNRPGRSNTKWPKNLPLWLEYGTRRMRQAFPHLLPALAAARERFSRAVERLLQRGAAA